MQALNPNLVRNPHNSHEIIPSEHLLKIIIKTKVKTLPKKGLSIPERDQLRLQELSEYIARVRERIARTYNVDPQELPDHLILSLRNYITDAYLFSPSIFVRNRQEQHLEQAQGQILSVDFAGQNIKNITKTLIALNANHNKPVLEILNATRQGEIEATVVLKKSAQNLKDFLDEAFGQNLNEYILSGDDGIAFFEKGYKINTSAIVKYLTSLKSPSALRFTLTPEGVAAEDRSLMVVQAESLEKEMRLQLEQFVSVADINSTGIFIENLGTTPENNSFKVTATGPIPLPILMESLQKSLLKLGYAKKVINASKITRLL